METKTAKPSLMHRLKSKPLFWIIGILLLGLLIKLLFFRGAEQPNYLTASVQRGDIEQTVLADGTVKAYKQVSVGAQVSGQIKKLYVKLGDTVKTGQLIAEIDDLTQQNNYKQAEASLEVLKAQRASKEAILKNDQLNYNRLAKIVNRGAVSRADLDAAKSSLDSVKAEIKALDANIISQQIAVNTAKLNLGYTKITSPMDGVIVAIPVEEGQTVNSVQTAPTIVKVAQLDKMTVEAKISEADVVKVKNGMPVYFTILGDNAKTYRGMNLRDIEPAPDSINNESTTSSLSSSTSNSAIYYNGLFDVDNPDRALRISMTAQVYIVLAQEKNVLYVPSMALQQQSGDEAIVRVIDDDNQVTERKVKVGINNNINAEIIANLKEGEKVVVSGGAGAGTAKANAPRMRMRM